MTAWSPAGEAVDSQRGSAGRALARASALAVLAALALTLAAAGCGDVIDASDFDQTCVVDEDCVVVLVGEMCDCICTTAGINRGDLPKYDAAVRAKACGTLCSPCADVSKAACRGGMCAAE